MLIHAKKVKYTFPLRALSIGVLLTGITGCSALNIGSPEYGCPGMPDGVQCMSTSDVYASTENGQVPRPMTPKEAKNKNSQKESGKNEQVEQETASSINGSGDVVIDNYVSPRIPNRPIPIRTPAEVMRIWVAPWEDTNGDLIVTGYIYTEIEPRRWTIGDSAPKVQTVIKPLE